MSRPNILYVFTDQQSAAAMSCSGNPDIATPNLDALAASGMRFDRAYCTCPVCSPSRASMLSGLMPHEHGVIKNDIRMTPERAKICLEHLLGAQGYDCAYAGKWHVGPYRGMEDEDVRRHPYRVLSKWDGPDPIATVTDACTAFIAEEHDQPFFLVASYDSPHEICGWRNGRKGLQPDTLDECPALPANFAVPDGEPSVLREVYMDRHYEHKELDNDGWRRYRWAYYRYIERADQAVGRLLAALDENDLRDNTLVIFSSDHGDGMGAHQWLSKCCHYDEVTRVPFIVNFPGRIAPGQVDTRLVSSGLDFYATALDYAGIELPGGCEGRSVRPDTTSSNDRHDHVVTEIWVAGAGNIHGGWEDNPFGRMLRTDRYKYVIYGRGDDREQLFDLQDDSLETRSITDDQDAQDILQEHRNMLLDWCRKTNDSVGVAML